MADASMIPDGWVVEGQPPASLPAAPSNGGVTGIPPGFELEQPAKPSWWNRFTHELAGSFGTTAKGVPGLGALVPQSQAATDYETAHPGRAAGLQIAAGVGATAPLVAAAPMSMGAEGSLAGRAIWSALSGGAIAGGDQAARDYMAPSTGQPRNNPSAVMTALGIPSTGSRPLDAALTAGGIGAVATPAASAVSAAVAPALSTAVQQLRNAGVRLTAGQTLEGPLGWAEKQTMKNVPIIGDLVKNARGQSVESFNTAVGNRALGHIGETVPDGVNVGHDLVTHVGDTISAEYQRVLPQLAGVSDNGFSMDLQHILADYQPRLRAQEYATLDEMVNHQIPRQFSVSPWGIMGGDDLKNLESWLSQRYRMLNSNNATAYDRELGQAIGDIQDAFHGMLERQNNPATMEALRNANAAWGDYVQMRNAAAAPGAKNGVFNPTQYLSAVRQSALNKGQIGRGAANNQPFANAARAVIPSDIPDSGTPHGLNLTHIVAGVLGGEHLPGAIMVPAIGAGIGASNLGQSVARGLIAGGMPVRQPVAEALRRLGPQAAMAASRGGGAATPQQNNPAVQGILGQ